MSESEPINEFESKEPSAVARYYDYVNDAEGNAATVVMALAELLDHLPATINLPIEMLFNAENYEIAYQADARATREELALLPLLYISPRLEQSDCPTDKLQAWYDDVVKKIVYQTRREHDVGCLTYSNDYPTTMMCNDSTECPQRILERYLSEGAWSPDFGSMQYVSCPNRAKTITVDKLAIGEKHQIFTPAYHQTTLHMYEREYEDYITDLVEYFSDSIDNNKHK